MLSSWRSSIRVWNLSIGCVLSLRSSLGAPQLKCVGREQRNGCACCSLGDELLVDISDLIELSGGDRRVVEPETTCVEDLRSPLSSQFSPSVSNAGKTLQTDCCGAAPGMQDVVGLNRWLGV